MISSGIVLPNLLGILEMNQNVMHIFLILPNANKYHQISIWRVPKMGIPMKMDGLWFVMENPNLIAGWLGGPPFMDTPI